MKKLLSSILMAVIVLIIVFTVSGCAQTVAVGYEGYNDPSRGKNTDKTFNIAGGWSKTGIGTHFASGPDMGPVGTYCLEGCLLYSRGSDDITYLIAEDFIHASRDPNDDVHDGESVIVIRDNAYWHDGGKVVAMDIMSYYALCYTTLTNYVYDMYVLDDNNNGDLTDDMRIKIVWRPWREPTDDAKTMLLAQDTKNCSVQYSKFKPFVDASLDLIVNGIDGVPNDRVTENSEGIGEIRLGRHANAIAGELGVIYNNFRSTVLKPDGKYDGYYYCGTGAFKVQSVTENQMVLVKNESYYYADKVGFDKIVVTQYSNGNMIYSDLQNGKLDFVDGCFDKQLTESILKSNGALVSYKMYDQGTVGIYYNLEKPIWENDKVRLAFQYLLDRETIQQIANPYAIPSYKPLMAMSPVEARKYLDGEVYNMIENYSHDTSRAEALLKEAGWTKKDGAWHDDKGTKVVLTLGYQNVTTFSTVAQSAVAQFKAFGLDVIMKSGNDMTTWFSTATAADSIYDFVIGHAELNTYASHPGGSMKHFFEVIQAPVMHIPVEDGKYTLKVDLLDSNDPNVSLGKVKAIDLYNKIYSLSGVELKQAANSLVLGISKYNYGIQLYENVTGAWFNADRVGGLPSVELFSVNRNVTVIPEITDEVYSTYVKIHNGFSQDVGIVEGLIYAR